MKKFSLLVLSVLFVFSCKKEEKLTFTEENTLMDESVVVEINIPKANKNSSIGNSINTTIDNHIANALNFEEDEAISLTLDSAIKTFKDNYLLFKDDYNEGALIWEASFDGEVIHHTDDVITIALSSYINTGGAHGNTNITLYNFNTQTGKVYSKRDIIAKEKELIAIAKPYFAKEVGQDSNESFEDFFFGDPFHLPANIGFNDEGLLVLYNVYEIASYAQGITEFTIPLDKVSHLLNVY